MRVFFFTLVAWAAISQPAAAQPARDSVARAELLRAFRAAQNATADSLERYRAVLLRSDSLLAANPADPTIRQVRLLTAAVVVNAGVQKARLVATYTTIRGLQETIGDHRTVSGFGGDCTDCARAASQLRIAKRFLDSLSRVKKCR